MPHGTFAAEVAWRRDVVEPEVHSMQLKARSASHVRRPLVCEDERTSLVASSGPVDTERPGVQRLSSMGDALKRQFTWKQAREEQQRAYDAEYRSPPKHDDDRQSKGAKRGTVRSGAQGEDASFPS